MTDDELLTAFEELTLPPTSFGHKEHVRVAWICLGREPSAAGRARVMRGLRAFATHAGAPGKYDEALTRGWLDRIAARRGPAGETWAAFVAAHPELLERRLRPEQRRGEGEHATWPPGRPGP
jgi:hypothetical protein